MASKELLINEQITDKEVRVVDNDGSQLGIMSLRDAQDRAAAQNLDLVKIAPQANPPVCRIMDYGKYKFDQSKREKEARRTQKQVEIKEIRLSVNIDVHDFATKRNHTQRFLEEGNKVKVSVRFRGREMSHTSLGEARLLEFAEACKEYGTYDKPPKLEGRNMSMVLSPILNKQTKEKQSHAEN
ncbi:MAG: translation initiation factor IF-3 [Clostridiales bacterium]|nr:translation initiation factor IF-3 [Clostridiales bacterium]